MESINRQKSSTNFASTIRSEIRKSSLIINTICIRVNVEGTFFLWYVLRLMAKGYKTAKSQNSMFLWEVVGQTGGVGLSVEREKGRGSYQNWTIYLFIHLIYLFTFIYFIIYLKFTSLQRYSIHIYVKVARQIG